MTKERTILGNYYNKYYTNNPIEKFLVGNYIKAFKRIVASLDVKTVYEVGTGEGFLLKLISEIRPDVKLIGSDISSLLNWSLFENIKLNPSYLINRAENIPLRTNAIDLVVACEVLEHLENPTLCLEEFRRLNVSHYLLSVPNEPLWRILNVMRFKYIRDFGNTPGHLNHWSKNSFYNLVSLYLDIEDVFYVQPWIFILAKNKR